MEAECVGGPMDGVRLDVPDGEDGVPVQGGRYVRTPVSDLDVPGRDDPLMRLVPVLTWEPDNE